MASEARRGLVRITSNYARVITGIVVGLATVPLLLHATGNDGWSLIALLGSTVGLASMAQEIVRLSLIRELGESYHRDRDGSFGEVYNAAIAISAALAALGVIVFIGLWLIVPLLEIPDHLLSAARWLVAVRGAETVLVLLLAAPFNMYKVSERMVAHNAWLIANRLCYLVGAVAVLGLADPDDPGRAVIWYAVISSVLLIATQVGSVVVIGILERGLLPRPGLVRWEIVRGVLHIGGWNAGATAATMSNRRLMPLLMNLAFGLPGNLVLGLALQLTVSVRRLTTGMTEGLDAVSARLSTSTGDHAIRSLLHHATRMHGFATFPVAALLIVLAEPLLLVWLGDRIENPLVTVPQATALTRILAVGMMGRAIGDGWMRILYGAGHVTRYAWIILLGGVLGPVLFFVLLLILPDAVGYTAVCWAYTAVYTVIHGGAVPVLCASRIDLRVHQFYTPLIRPLVVTAACTPLLLVSGSPGDGEWSLLRLLLVAGGFGVVYTAAAIVFVMDRAERVRFGGAIGRQLASVRKGRRV